jgi:hypothetical protein
MISNKYVEHSKWTLMWGIFLNEEEEIQKFINKYNKEGWNITQFQWSLSKDSIFKRIIIFLITFFSLGFISYWHGFSIIFEKNTNTNSSENNKSVNEFTEWKKTNPDKSINDFYRLKK